MPESPTALKVAPTQTGCCIRVEGQGTIRQSPAARGVAERTLACDASATVVFDLSACDYLDSTFLGCLMDLYRTFGRGTPGRYQIAASVDRRKKLFGPTHLDRLIPMLDASPAVCGAWVDVRCEEIDKKAMLRHVMECHRALAEVESPMRGAFARIAEQIEKELGSG
jgi:anti-anti-sigma regulatory factor